ncbi:MAG: phage tail protein, partial [Pseudomonadota bacterium]
MPDLVERAPKHTGLLGGSLGTLQGSSNVTLNTSQLPPHTHKYDHQGVSLTTGMSGLGQPFLNEQPTQNLNYLINTGGQNPADADSGVTFLGQVVLSGLNFAPSGWSFADGQLLNKHSNQDLYNLVGTTFGGDGVSTFALPDLRNRV